MAEEKIDTLRALRTRARRINESLVPDLGPFINEDGSFRKQPPPNLDKPASVSTTCTALMALASTKRLQELYPADPIAKAAEVFKSLFDVPWTSSGLVDGNAFTRVFVLRAAGFLASTDVLRKEEVPSWQHNGQSFREIVHELANDPPSGLRIASYPVTAAVAYWYVDGVDRLGIWPDEQFWKRIADWVSGELYTQLSFIAAGDEAMKDPVALAMAASLIARLRRISVTESLAEGIAHLLPSEVVLRHAVCEVFRHQITDSGIWPKYFPLFHYPEAGANYCFSFEFLEALLNEFGVELLAQELPLNGLTRSIDWCERNRRKYRFKGQDYCGWHSGGELTSLRAGQPEPWATSTVHLFLSKLRETLSDATQDAVLLRYGLSHVSAGPDDRRWARLVDATVEMPGEGRTTVKTLIEREIITPAKAQGAANLRQRKLTSRRSGLLFGPPGTAKTSLVRALAGKLGWPCVEIHPSHFLDRGLDMIYLRANEIFDDLMDLSGIVILFDEMDPLFRRREPQLDVYREFLTTSMLPKLAELYERANVISFVNTNHRKEFDEAITRPGRFDFLLCVGPPSWKEKLNNLGTVIDTASGDSLEKLQGKLEEWVPRKDALESVLDRFTLGEFRTLFEQLLRRRGAGISKPDLDVISREEFRSMVKTWGESRIILWRKKLKKSRVLATYDEDKALSQLQ